MEFTLCDGGMGISEGYEERPSGGKLALVLLDYDVGFVGCCEW